MMGMKIKKLIIILFLAIGTFAVYYSTDWLGNLNATIWGNGAKEFAKPVDIVWQGEVISTMAGGSCLGLKGEFDKYSFATVCLPEGDSGELWKFGGMVTITGKWLGITCAYKNTIFGECVPEVNIEKIESLQ